MGANWEKHGIAVMDNAAIHQKDVLKALFRCLWREEGGSRVR